jgi:hypothetical protein
MKAPLKHVNENVAARDRFSEVLLLVALVVLIGLVVLSLVR